MVASAPVAMTRASVTKGLARFAWGVLAFTTAVALFGAVVRITGSGAGCGQNWPTCQGEMLHLPTNVHGAIEYTHRLSSGLSFALVTALAVLVVRRSPPAHASRGRALTALALMVVEALLGAVLVLFQLVEQDRSLMRVIVMPLHNVNMSLLLGALALTGRALSRPPRLASSRAGLLPQSRREWLLASLLLATLLVSASGAVTALGDTVFPVIERGLGGRFLEDHGPGAHLLQRLRFIHPVLAMVFAVFGFWLLSATAELGATLALRRWARAALVLLFLQVMIGIANVWWSAPGWLQVVHLAMAVATWLAALMSYDALVDARAVSSGGSPPEATT